MGCGSSTAKAAANEGLTSSVQPVPQERPVPGPVDAPAAAGEGLASSDQPEPQEQPEQAVPEVPAPIEAPAVAASEGPPSSAQPEPQAQPVPDVPAPLNVPPPEFYIAPDSIYTLLEPAAEGKPAPVRLLDSEWVLRRADALAAATTDAERERLALPRRQELERLHPEAYLGAEALRALPTGHGGALPVGAVSHAWLDVSHPDPRGEQLVRLAALIRKAQGGQLRRQQRNPEMPDISEYKPLPARVGLFFDWASICQHQKAADGAIVVERTADEEAAFRAALESMQIWYVHQKLFTILVTDLPARCAGAVAPYDARGWPTVERAWANVAKPNNALCWPMLYDVGTGDEAARAAPLHPQQVAELLATKKFTSPKADLPLVLRLYNETIISVLGGAKVLNFRDAGWQPRDGVSFARVLPYCAEVETIYMVSNAIGDEGCAAIAEAATRGGALPKLKLLGVQGAEIGDAGCRALAAAVRAGALPQLETMRFHMEMEGCRNLAGEAARAELRAACEARGAKNIYC